MHLVQILSAGFKVLIYISKHFGGLIISNQLRLIMWAPSTLSRKRERHPPGVCHTTFKYPFVGTALEPFRGTSHFPGGIDNGVK